MRSWLPQIAHHKLMWLILSSTTILILGVLSLNAILTQHSTPSDNQTSPTPTPTSIAGPTVSPTPTRLSPTPPPSKPSTPTPTSQQPIKPTPTPTAIPLMPEIVWGNQSTKQVIFTFDAGSGNQSINQILSTLEQFNVEGSFFITGTWATSYSSDLKNIARDGHAIYNHTYTHPHLTQLEDQAIIAEFQKTDAVISSIVGFNSKPYFRAPYGERDQRVLSLAANQGYRHVYWTIDAWDWKEGITAMEVKSRILDNLAPGTIYLMHVGDSITGQILADVFSQIKQKGYQINSLNTGL